MTISPTIRVVLLATIALALGAAAFVVLGQNHTHASTADQAKTAATVSHSSVRTIHHPVLAHHRASVAAAAAGPDVLPANLVHALRYHSVVVAVLYAPGVAGEDSLVAFARQGARAAHAGFVPLNVRSERIAESVALKFPGAFDPAVLIVKRSGTVVTELDGVQQSTAVAQAVLDARR